MVYKRIDGVSEETSSGYALSINAVVADGVEDAYADTNITEDYAAAYDDSRPVTAAEVDAIVRNALADIRVYVLESDITKAQENVKSVVEESYF